jgi:lipopolysaccharide export system permease protein
MENVYLFMPQTSRQKRPTTIGYAEKGYVTQDEDNIMWLVLEDGTFYIGPNEKNKYTKMDYDEYRTQLADNSQDQNEIKINAVPTSELLTMSGPVATAELQWRLCVALAIPILTLIVVPLASVRPRQGKFAKFLPALMIYGSFFLLMVSLKHLISKGIFPAFPGLYILIFAYFVLFAVPLNMTETKWYKKYQLQKIRKQSDKSKEIKN